MDSEQPGRIWMGAEGGGALRPGASAAPTEEEERSGLACTPVSGWLVECDGLPAVDELPRDSSSSLTDGLAAPPPPAWPWGSEWPRL